MRIACIHIPQFALQSATRVDPALRGAPVAVVSGIEIDPSARSGRGVSAAGVLHAPIVTACSRAAWGLGVRLGMTATAARTLSPELQLVTADANNERETVRAIADSVLGAIFGSTAIVDVGGRVGAGGAHLAMYCAVPAKTRGQAFGERLLEVLEQLGLTARIGIADDRFTAWVAASQHTDADARARATESSRTEPEQPRSTDGGVVTVPRGGSAAFLAPRPLSLLAISPEVQHMLEALGVRTLGEFAALPAPSIARPLEADYRALARGESDATLRPYAPEAPIREEVVVSAGNVLELQDLLPAGEHAGGLSFAGAVGLIAQRIALRLAGRVRGAARLEVTAIGNASAREFPITLAHGTADAEELGHVLSATLEPVAAEHTQVHDTWRLRVAVVGEVILGGDTVEVFAEGSRPLALEVHRGHIPPADIYASDHRGHIPPADIYASASRDDIYERSGARNANQRTDDHHSSGTIDPLTLVLSSPGSVYNSWALSPPTVRSERRDAHRRTQRGKQRRSRPTPRRSETTQSRLFDRTSSKS